MPKKIKELKYMLLKAGFICKFAKASHTKWTHPNLPLAIIMSGKDGNDAKPYQEKQVNHALELLKKEDSDK